MEHFLGEKNNFEDDSLINWEPVKLIAEDWSYVVTLLGKRYQVSSHVLNSLKFVNIFLWKAIQQRIMHQYRECLHTQNRDRIFGSKSKLYCSIDLLCECKEVVTDIFANFLIVLVCFVFLQTCIQFKPYFKVFPSLWNKEDNKFLLQNINASTFQTFLHSYLCSSEIFQIWQWLTVWMSLIL